MDTPPDDSTLTELRVLLTRAITLALTVAGRGLGVEHAVGA